jgi:RimJ/RimL family protein N-acetyltransferase
MEKAGMTFEGILRGYCIRENEHMNYRVYEDLGMCAILRSEWQNR